MTFPNLLRSLRWLKGVQRRGSKLFGWISSLWASVKPRARFLPLIGRLSDCSFEDLKEAFYEVGIATFFATMPLWFLPLLGGFFFKSGVPWGEGIKTGELFIYSAAVAGPLVYIITKRYGSIETNFGKKDGPVVSVSISFPYGGLFVGIAAFMCILSGFAFTILKNPNFSTPEDIRRINYDGIIKLSWYMFFLTSLVLYCVTAYKNMLEHVSRSQSREEKAFLADWLEQKNAR